MLQSNTKMLRLIIENAWQIYQKDPIFERNSVGDSLVRYYSTSRWQFYKSCTSRMEIAKTTNTSPEWSNILFLPTLISKWMSSMDHSIEWFIVKVIPSIRWFQLTIEPLPGPLTLLFLMVLQLGYNERGVLSHHTTPEHISFRYERKVQRNGTPRFIRPPLSGLKGCMEVLV